MRRRIILSLVLLFALFTSGAGISMYYINVTADRLDSLVGLHQVEIMRQNLVIKAQKVQSELYTVNTVFRQELDTVVADVRSLDGAVHACLNCHHEPEIDKRLRELHPLVEEYKKTLSHAITASANKERIEKIKIMASDIGNDILSRTTEMTIIATQHLKERTSEAIQEINNSRDILIATMIGAFVIALLIAISLTREITQPVAELLDFARRLASDQFDRGPLYRGRNEFGELAAAFEQMRVNLLESKERIMNFIRKLSGLYETTLSIHSVAELGTMFSGLPVEIAGLLNVEECGFILFDENSGNYIHQNPAYGVSSEKAKNLEMTSERARVFFECTPEGTFIANNPSSSRELLECFPVDKDQRNLLISWIHRKGRIMGAVRAANKLDDEFRQEDAQLLSILANHMAVAIENRRLYNNLKMQMNELRDAQEQLVQSTKLAAIGELASNVAHEINNPLTSILGYTELLKEEEDIRAVRADLGVIEQECIRARTIVKQLLEFSRRRPLDIQQTDVNKIIGEVIPLVNVMAKAGRVKITKHFAELLPTKADANQLKQVFINLMNNAIFAMNGGGTLTLTTRMADDEEGIIVSVQDTGSGIPKEIQPRIFEPFFSTKNDKGTGLGLSISYSIVQNHGGRLSMESEPSKGTTFSVWLPVKLEQKEAEKETV